MSTPSLSLSLSDVSDAFRPSARNLGFSDPVATCDDSGPDEGPEIWTWSADVEDMLTGATGTVTMADHWPVPTIWWETE